MGFTKKNTYYSGTVYEWNLPTGWTCPFADECLVKVDKETGKQENKSSSYKCYAASAERFPGVRKSRWNNLELSKTSGLPSLPRGAEAVRIHASGDFYSQKYFDLWLNYATDNPKVEFWAYTKSLKYWVERLGEVPDNLVLTASYGGRSDHLIKEHGLKSALVVESLEAAAVLGLPVDNNDDVARVPKINFALVDNYAPKDKS
tara:strand:+ start:2160 stop:2768 length:609 start_codon:yes stop_codon:yes gene_type:complete